MNPDHPEAEKLWRSLAVQGITDERVLDVMRSIPRDLFVDDDNRAALYQNIPLSIGEGQTISQPYVVALMTQALAPLGYERVLEIGTGSGYQTAILSRLAAFVVSIERFPSLSAAAVPRLRALGISNVELHVGDGSLGWPSGGPYDAIIVTAAGPRVPDELFAQLAPGPHSRLLMPVGPRVGQALLLVKRGTRNQDPIIRDLGGVRFVPLVGEAGWPDDDPAISTENV